MPARILLFVIGLTLSAVGQVSVLTYQYDVSRDGVNPNEIGLTPQNVNVNQFGKLFSYPVDGQVYTQPLYVANLNMGSNGTHDVVFVATEHDSVYAFDADGPGASASGPLWHVSFLNPAAGVTTVPYLDTECTQIVPEIGITGTPAIDRQSGTLYVVAMTKENGNYVHRLHALDITTGQERPGSPVVIQASVPGSGDGGSTVTLIPKNYKQRAGLLLLNGIVYTGWSSHCDLDTYHGWLLGYDAQTLAQVSVFNATPNGGMGAFWAGGAAPAADTAGNIYVVSANGTFDRAMGGPDLGESYIKLAAGGLSVLDYFTPFNEQVLSNGDADTGSAGVALLGDEAGSPQHPHLMVGGGKGRTIYLIDRDHLGGMQMGSDSQIVQSISGVMHSLFGNPAYFNQTVYLCASGDGVLALPIANAQLATTPSSRTNEFPYPGCVPTISANGLSNGIVWSLESTPALHAHDASNLANELYNSNQNQARDALDSFLNFSVPTVANAKVYAPTAAALVVYGLLPPGSGNLGISDAASGDPNAIAPGSIVSIYGQGLAQTATVADQYPLPQPILAGASVTMNGWPAPIFFASPGQLNVQVPFEVSGQVTVVVSVNGVPVNSGSITVNGTGPGIFLLAQGRAAALNTDYSINNSSNPAPVGGAVSLFVTGLGAMSPALATGAPAGGNGSSTSAQGVTATIGGQAATVIFAGGAPGYAGLDQVNVMIPQLAPGDYPIQIFAGSAASNSATISVR